MCFLLCIFLRIRRLGDYGQDIWLSSFDFDRTDATLDRHLQRYDDMHLIKWSTESACRLQRENPNGVGLLNIITLPLCSQLQLSSFHEFFFFM